MGWYAQPRTCVLTAQVGHVCSIHNTGYLETADNSVTNKDAKQMQIVILQD